MNKMRLKSALSEESNSVISSSRKDPRLSGVEVAVQDPELTFALMATQNLHGHDQRIL